MKSLRRDLLERRLWPVVVLLVAAIIAVPLLLRAHATAAAHTAPASAPLPAHEHPAGHATRHEAGAHTHAAHTHTAHAHVARDPFRSPVKHAETRRSATATAPSSTGSSPQTSPSKSLAHPSATATEPAASGPASTTTSTHASTPAHETTPRIRAGDHSGTPGSTMPQPTKSAAPLRSWTIYGVDVRIGPAGHPSARLDIPRYTPLPRAATPRAMFAGVGPNGQAAVFELASGVQARGSGRCKPDRAHCSAVILPVQSVERLTFADARGEPRTLLLKTTRITSRVTHSKAQELAAVARHSADGACELELGNPTGSAVKNLPNAPGAVSDACQAHGLVPFPDVTESVIDDH